MDVSINERPVEPSTRDGCQPIHLGEILQPGQNDVTLRSLSEGASGGMFYIFVAEGEITNAEMRLDTPAVQFGLGSTREGSYERTYTVEYTP